MDKEEQTSDARDPSADEFLNDPRVSFDKVANKWIFEGDDGTEWVYDSERNQWMQQVCVYFIFCFIFFFFLKLQLLSPYPTLYLLLILNNI